MGEIGAGLEVAKRLRESFLLPAVIDVHLCEWPGQYRPVWAHTMCSVTPPKHTHTHIHTHTHVQCTQ